jgi:hypothetical protein
VGSAAAAAAAATPAVGGAIAVHVVDPIPFVIPLKNGHIIMPNSDDGKFSGGA